MASMIFWALRLGLGLAGMFLLFFDWRVGLVILFVVAEEFLTFLWMALPLFSVRYDLAVVFGVALAVGLLTCGDEKNRIWWMPAAVGAAVLVLLRGALYLNGIATGSIGRRALSATVPGAVVLIVGTGAALVLPSALRELRRRRSER